MKRYRQESTEHWKTLLTLFFSILLSCAPFRIAVCGCGDVVINPIISSSSVKNGQVISIGVDVEPGDCVAAVIAEIEPVDIQLQDPFKPVAVFELTGTERLVAGGKPDDQSGYFESHWKASGLIEAEYKVVITVRTVSGEK